jgi:uncharacterized protein YpuA (DUF1002 family)
MKNIDEMKTWEIIDYIRENRKYQIIEGGDKGVIESMFNIKMTDTEWSKFSNQVEKRQDVLHEYIESMYDGIFSYKNDWR